MKSVYVADDATLSTTASVFAFFFFFQAEDGIRDYKVTGVQTCALPISRERVERRAIDPGQRRRIARRARGKPVREARGLGDHPERRCGRDRRRVPPRDAIRLLSRRGPAREGDERQNEGGSLHGGLQVTRPTPNRACYVALRF